MNAQAASQPIVPQTMQSTSHESPPPSRWAVWIAHAVPLCLLPSALWRIAMVFGVPVGFTAQELREQYDLPGWIGATYILALVIVLELLALLSLGLVQRWGEIFPPGSRSSVASGCRFSPP